ncbi:unnamed protein product [Rodentolepis nana]|uniref:ECM11 domain-containing protein n=1 Tax=Rodentolepis nana TaxID=102285 RepID=A0A0R3TJX1_RODNA|nr:unnamed protein product [Rodentolepis nana]
MPLIDFDSGVKPKRAQCKFPWEENLPNRRQDAESNESVENSSLFQYNVKNPMENFNETGFGAESNRHRRAIDYRRSRNHKHSDFPKSKVSTGIKFACPRSDITEFRNASPSKLNLFNFSEETHSITSAPNRPTTPNSELLHVKRNSGEMVGKTPLAKQRYEMPVSGLKHFFQLQAYLQTWFQQDNQSSYTAWKLSKLQQELDKLCFRMDKTEDQLSLALRSIEKIGDFMRKALSKSELKTESDT